MIKPWVGYVTIVDVDHEDHVISAPTGWGGELLGLPGTVEVAQGVFAGAVVETGEGVPVLPAGVKVYYVGQAIVVGEEKLIDARRIIGWEEE